MPPRRVSTGLQSNKKLLLVTFATDAGTVVRSKAAASVSGKLAGEAPTGESVCGGADSISIREAAGQLIQVAGVAEIAERSCP